MATQSKRYLENLQYAQDPRVRAYLDVLADLEGTKDTYNMRVGGSSFDPNTAHPDNSITITSNGKKLKSDAAGRYQFMGTTWAGLAKKMPELKGSMSAQNQDVGAIELIREKGALDAVLKGDLATALHKTRNVWASAPTSELGQPRRSVQFAVDAYNRRLTEHGVKAPPLDAATITAGLTNFKPGKGVQASGDSFVALAATPALSGGDSAKSGNASLATAELINAGKGVPGSEVQSSPEIAPVGALSLSQGAIDAGLTPLGAETAARTAASIMEQLRQPAPQPTAGAAMTDVEGRDVLAKLQPTTDDELARQQDTTLAYLLGQQKTEQPNFEIPSAVDRYLEQKLTAG